MRFQDMPYERIDFAKVQEEMGELIRELDAAKSFYREKDVPREVEAYRPPLDYNELLKDMTLAKLQEIFEGILKRQEDKKDPVRSNFGRIEKDEVSVDQKAVYVEEFIRTHKRFSFRALLEKQHSKVEVIVTFLVVLELMKTGKITALWRRNTPLRTIRSTGGCSATCRTAGWA